MAEEIRRTAGDPLLAVIVVAVLLSLVVFILYPLVSVVLTSFKVDRRFSTAS
jgi:hypothetical protein